MQKKDTRFEVLNKARQSLTEANGLSPEERGNLVKLLDVLMEAAEEFYGSGSSMRKLSGDLIDNASLILMLQQHTDELDTLKKLSLNLTSSLDLPTVLDAVVAEAMRLVKNARAAHIFLYNLDGQLEFGASLNDDGIRNQPLSLPRKEGLTYTVARSGEQIIIEDMSQHPLYKDSQQNWAGSIIGMPLKINDNVVGVMNLSKTTTGGYPPSELRLLRLLADQAAVAISNASLHLTVSKQAYSDAVTGLPNRRALDERLANEVRSARRTGHFFAVIMMDLDGFKVINDTNGHAVGDQVLRAISNHLATGLRTSDFLARYGGDEFTLILNQADPASASLVTDKISETMRRFTFSLPDGQTMKLGISGGIALYPIHATTSADLLRAADEALYRAKRHQRGSFMLARGFTGELRSPELE